MNSVANLDKLCLYYKSVTQTKDTISRIMDVTESVVELAVIYLKNATRDVVDTSVNDVKIILGRMTENREIEPVAEFDCIEQESSRL